MLKSPLRPTEQENPEPELVQRNPSYPSLSGLVRVEEVGGKGRGAVAGERLLPGTLVARERAMASTLYIPKVDYTPIHLTILDYMKKNTF